jgi:hypothetical protein
MMTELPGADRLRPLNRRKRDAKKGHQKEELQVRREQADGPLPQAPPPEASALAS